MRCISLLIAVLLFGHGLLHAQLPQLTSSDKATPIVLQKLSIDVRIIGSISVTTYTMTFYNGSDKVLEGTFLLSLPEGVAVTRYALDIEDKMREGVPVEKARATEVFESVEKRRIDPGLLEKTDGNVFRTRIYPIPAHGHRSIIIAFEQELRLNSHKELVYHLPLDSKEAIRQFSLNIQVQQKGKAPVLESSPVSSLAFSQFENQYCAYQKKEAAVLTQPLTVRIPKAHVEVESFVQKRGGEHYFYLQTFVPPASKDKKLPKNLAVIWDRSLSGLYRNTAREIAFLQAYLERCQNVSVQLYTLNNTFKQEGIFEIRNGNTKELAARLEKMIYDGGTDYTQIKFPHADETLLFTDGLSTLSDADVLSANHVVYTISASSRADYSVLQSVAEMNGGTFINLNTASQNEALGALTKQTLLFLGIRNNTGVEERYPQAPTPVVNGFSMAGMLKQESATLTLQFGYGRAVAFEKTVQLQYDAYDAPEWNLSKVLAQKKIMELDRNYEKHADEIIQLGKKHGIVTRQTSLLVLEDVRDYVQHGIEPPSDLWPQYKELLKQRTNEITRNQKSTLENAVKYSEALWAWWNTDFPLKRKARARETDAIIQTDRVASAIDNGTSRVTPPPPSRLEETQFSPPQLLRDEEVVTRALQGAVPGVQVHQDALSEVVVVGYSTQARSVASYKAENSTDNPLLIVDGKIATSLPPKGSLEQMESLAANRAVALYGAKAINGVWIITTKDAKEKLPEIVVEEKTSNAAYLKELAATPRHLQYGVYLQLRDKNLLNPTFYYDVANFFLKQDKALGLQILSNLADLDFQNHELYKLFAFKLKELGQPALQQFILRKVLLWRPQEPQSYRDYALALLENGKYQAALDTLYLALAKDYNSDVMSNYEGIEETIVTEINHLVHRYPQHLNTSAIHKNLLHQMPVDIRVVLNWNMNDTDIDLWVTDPKGEKCFYSHPATAIGGRLSEDFTRGYGPEQFLLQKAEKGKYKIQVHYYGENGVKIAGKTTLLVEVFTNYGSINEQRKQITLQLEEEEREGIYVGEFIF